MSSERIEKIKMKNRESYNTETEKDLCRPGEILMKTFSEQFKNKIFRL